jgi:hypothetical protein
MDAHFCVAIIDALPVLLSEMGIGYACTTSIWLRNNA